MFQIIDEMSELIYVVDPVTYDLLYMNRSGLESFGLEDIKGRKCYEVLHDNNSPCKFCTNSFLTENSFYTWELTNQKLRQHFLLKDKIIDWDGHKVKIEIAFDITEKETKRIALQKKLEAENLITTCARLLCSAEANPSSLDDALRVTGLFMNADRAVLYLQEKSRLLKSNEWCAEGVPAAHSRHLNMPDSLHRIWEEYLAQEKPTIIPSVDVLCRNCPQSTEFFLHHHLHSLAMVPLTLENDCIGYLRLDNIDSCVPADSNVLLTSIGFFLSAAICRMWSTEKLNRMGYYDTLTNLMNRNGFNRDLAKKPEFPLGVIYLDVNGTKQFNDLHGHQYGDQILIDAANTIRRECPDRQTYRIGGDEFVILCPNTEYEDFQFLLHSLKHRFGQKSHYSIAVGNSWCCKPMAIEKLLQKADEQMYQDKQQHYRNSHPTGRYRFFLDDIYSMARPGALKQLLDSGSFLIYYQPKFSISDMAPTGSEALVRYQDKQGKILAPDEFIPMLEETRLIGMLDFYVFEQVCEKLQEWTASGFPAIPVSINLSRHTLEMDNVTQKLLKIFENYSLPPDLVELEITETVEADNKELFSAVTKQLRKNHFRILIDDFGVRNANLNLFTDLDFDVIKIDRHMIHQLCNNPKSVHLLTTLTHLCHSMGITLTAEGIETPEQLAILRQIGCDTGQGYLFSKPLTEINYVKKFIHQS